MLWIILIIVLVLVLFGFVGRGLRAVVGEMEKTGGVVLVTGSLYMGAGALEWLRGR